MSDNPPMTAPPPPLPANPPITDAIPPAPAAPVPGQVDLTAYVAKYIALRDMIAEKNKQWEAELAPLKDVKNALDSFFGEQLAKSNVTSMRTTAGTITSTARKSATLEDALAFRTFVQQMGEWELADIRANADAVETYAKENKQLPPGVKYSVMNTISVRRASSK